MVVMMEKEHYISIIYEHLSDHSTYTLLHSDPTCDIVDIPFVYAAMVRLYLFTCVSPSSPAVELARRMTVKSLQWSVQVKLCWLPRKREKR